jgi:hypothetical protein
MDLAFTYKLDAADQVVTIDNFAAAGKSLFQGGMEYIKGNKEGAMKELMTGLKHLGKGLLDKQMKKMGGKFGGFSGFGGGSKENSSDPEGLHSADKVKKCTQATVIQWSGCRDDQTSADTKIENQATGECVCFLNILLRLFSLPHVCVSFV